MFIICSRITSINSEDTRNKNDPRSPRMFQANIASLGSVKRFELSLVQCT